MAKPARLIEAEALVKQAVKAVHSETSTELQALIVKDMLAQLYARPCSSGVLDLEVDVAARALGTV